MQDEMNPRYPSWKRQADFLYAELKLNIAYFDVVEIKNPWHSHQMIRSLVNDLHMRLFLPILVIEDERSEFLILYIYQDLVRLDDLLPIVTSSVYGKLLPFLTQCLESLK